MARKDNSRVTKRVASRMDQTQAGIFSFPSRPKNIPWYLVHRFLFKGLGITRLEVWDGLLRRYVTDPKNGIPQTPEHRTSARGNITSQVFSEDEGMSISTFIKTAVVANVEEIELIAVWKMADGRRIVGKVRYPLTPDILLKLGEEDEETNLIAEVSGFLQEQEESKSGKLKALFRKLMGHRKQKEEAGEKQ